MIAITVELIPAGHLPLRRTIASMRIANITDLADVSDYAVAFMEGANPLADTCPRHGSCSVQGHDRHQSVWALIAKAASAAMEAEYDEL